MGWVAVSATVLYHSSDSSGNGRQSSALILVDPEVLWTASSKLGSETLSSIPIIGFVLFDEQFEKLKPDYQLPLKYPCNIHYLCWKYPFFLNMYL